MSFTNLGIFTGSLSWNGSAFSRSDEITIPANSSYLIVRVCRTSSASDVDSIQFDGNSLTRLVHSNTENVGVSTIYYLENPSAITGNLTYLDSNAAPAISTVDVISGDATLTAGTGVTGSKTSPNSSNVWSTQTSFTTSPGDVILDLLTIDAGSNDLNISGGLNQNVQILDTTSCRASSKTVAVGPILNLQTDVSARTLVIGSEYEIINKGGVPSSRINLITDDTGSGSNGAFQQGDKFVVKTQWPAGTGINFSGEEWQETGSVTGMSYGHDNGFISYQSVHVAFSSTPSPGGIVDGQQDYAFTYDNSTITGTVTEVNLKATNGSDLNYSQSLNFNTSGTNGLLIDFPDISSYTSDTLGVPFTSSAFTVSLEVTDGSNTTSDVIQWVPKTGYAKTDVASAVTTLGSYFYGFTGSVVDNTQVYYSTSDNTTIAPSGIFTTDMSSSGSLAASTFDLLSGTWIYWSITLESIDSVIPTISITGSSTISVEVGGTYTPPTVTASDNIDGDITSDIVISGDTVDAATIGTYVVRYNVVDSAGNSAQEATVTVNVVDTTIPTITVDTSTETIILGGTYSRPTATASDAFYGDITGSIVISDNVDVNTTGSYNVTWDVDDINGNSAIQQIQTVNIVDTIKPEIQLNDAAVKTIEYGTYVAPSVTATDNYDNDTTLTSQIVQSGDVITASTDLGTYTVRYNVSDAAGNAADEVTQTITIQDTVAPVLNLNASSSINLNVGTAWTIPNVTATDTYDDDTVLTSQITQTGTVDPNTLSTYVVTWNVTDSNGNQAIPVSQTINVIDTGVPTILLNRSLTETVEVGASYSAPIPTAFDNADGDLTSDIVESGDALSSSSVGSFTRTYNVADSNGNDAAEVVYTLTVEDTIKPIISIPVLSRTLEFGEYVAQTVTATDNFYGSIAVVTSGDTVNASSLPGTYTIRYNAVDQNGLDADEVIETITIQDTTAPVINLVGSNNIDVEIDTTYILPNVTATDAVDGNVALTVSGTVDTSTLGTYTIAWNCSDSAGNAATEVTQTVNVVDTQIPVINLNAPAIIYLDIGIPYIAPSVTASDQNGTVDLTSNIITGGDVVNSGVPGTYVVTFNVNDASNNQALQVTQTVVVQEPVSDATRVTTWPTQTSPTGNEVFAIDDGTTFKKIDLDTISNYANSFNAKRGLITVNGIDSLGNTVSYNYQCKADGTTDDRAEILSALNKAIVSMPCIVEFGEGNYAMSDGIELDLADSVQGLTIKGQGANVTKLVWHNASVNNYYTLKIFSNNAKNYKTANSGAENVSIYPKDIFIEDIGFFDDDPFAHQTRGNDFLGTADSGTTTTMTDTGAFTVGLFDRVGSSTKFYIANTTTGAIGKIASNTVDTVTFDELVAGSSNTFSAGDGYQISCVDANNLTYGNQVEETHAVTIQYCRNAHIRNCAADAIGDEAFNFSFVKQGSMTGISCTHVPSMSFGGGAITIQHGCEDIVVADNLLDAGKTYGLLSEFEGSQGINLEAIDLAPISNISITGNKIRGMGDTGININSSFAGTSVSEISIASNNIVECGNGIGRLGSQPLHHVTVIGNTVDTITGYGVYIDAAPPETTEWIICDNTFSNCTTGGMMLNMSNALLSNNIFKACTRGIWIVDGVGINVSSGVFVDCGGASLEEIEDTSASPTSTVSNVVVKGSLTTSASIKGVYSLSNSVIETRSAASSPQNAVLDVRHVNGNTIAGGVACPIGYDGGTVSNNKIKYVPTSGAQDGINVKNTCSNFVISGNTIDLTGGTPSKCIDIDAGATNTLLVGNNLKSTPAGLSNALLDQGTDTIADFVNNNIST